MCYEDEKEEIMKRCVPQKGRKFNRNEFDDLYDDMDDLDEIDDLYEHVDIDKVIQDESIKNYVDNNENVKVYKPIQNQIYQNNHQNLSNNNQPEEKVSPDQLFNKIPENLQPKKSVEKQIEVDALFK
jgi:hypothetical protein